jgi:hypothetical protein
MAECSVGSEYKGSGILKVVLEGMSDSGLFNTERREQMELTKKAKRNDEEGKGVKKNGVTVRMRCENEGNRIK